MVSGTNTNPNYNIAMHNILQCTLYTTTISISPIILKTLSCSKQFLPIYLLDFSPAQCSSSLNPGLLGALIHKCMRVCKPLGHKLQVVCMQQLCFPSIAQKIDR